MIIIHSQKLLKDEVIDYMKNITKEMITVFETKSIKDQEKHMIIINTNDCKFVFLFIQNRSFLREYFMEDIYYHII